MLVDSLMHPLAGLAVGLVIIAVGWVIGEVFGTAWQIGLYAFALGVSLAFFLGVVFGG